MAWIYSDDVKYYCAWCNRELGHLEVCKNESCVEKNKIENGQLKQNKTLVDTFDIEVDTTQIDNAIKKVDKLIEKIKEATKLKNISNANKVYIVFNFNMEIENIYLDKESAKKSVKTLNGCIDKPEFFYSEYDIDVLED